jgi:hypothetical protein
MEVHRGIMWRLTGLDQAKTKHSPTTACEHCGDSIEDSDVEDDDGNVYCSEQCMRCATHICCHCEDHFDPDASDADEPEDFCSMSCQEFERGERRCCDHCDDDYLIDDSDAEEPGDYCCADCEAKAHANR